MGKMAELRTALADSLVGLEGVQENAYVLGNPTPPSVEVEPGKIDYDLAMGRGLDRWRFTVRLFLANTADIGAQKRLDEFIDPTGSQSIKTLIEIPDANGARTLGGVCDDVRVVNCSGYRTYVPAHGAGVCLGAEWAVECLVSN